MQANLDAFTRAYIECALFSSTVDPFGACPQCNRPDRILCRWDAHQTPVCADCSEREPNYEPPANDNYSAEDLAPETLARMITDCHAFQLANGEHIGMEYQLERTRWTSFEQAGHDFWLTRNGHGAGFWDGGWKEPQAKLLTDASKTMGEFNLYVGDDGLLYATS